MDAEVAQVLQRIIITFPAFLLALVVHEYSHAWMAARFGDQTATWNGRLTLNPMAHIDWLGTVILPIVGLIFGGFMFGWAKPVPIDPRQFRSYRRGLFWVSAAGPLSNFIFGFAASLMFMGVFKYTGATFSYREGMLTLLESLAVVNFMLGVFNLLPFPPMDGSNIVLSFLSYNATRIFYQIQQYSGMLVLLLMFTGAFRIISYPVFALFNLSQSVAAYVFGLA